MPSRRHRILPLFGFGALVLFAVSVIATTTADPADAADRKFSLPSGVLGELSGMAMSIEHPGVMYANIDSGNTNER